MSDEIVIDYAKIAAEVEASLTAKAQAKAEQEAQKQAEIEQHVKAALEKQEEKYQEELKKLNLRKSAPAFNQHVGRYSKSAGVDELRHWMKTGDNGNERVLKPDYNIGADGKEYVEAGGQKAMQIGSDTEGGYVVPEDFYTSIIEQRDQMAWTRNVGANVIQTDLTNVQIPIESTKMSKFAITAEEGSYSDSDPILGEVDVTVYKFTRMNKFSEELIADEKANLMQYYSNSLARAWALTESYYMAIGTGTAQPQGVFVGGTAGLTFDSSANITADEIPELFYKLGNGYRRDAVWLMNDDTEGYMRKIRDANDFAFDMRNTNASGGSGTWKYETFYGGKPIYTETAISTIGTGLKTVLIGDFGFYGLVEREGLSISRNPYLYQANGQVAFFSKVRFGGAVLQPEAFQYGTMT